MVESTSNILETRGISKRFGEVQALYKVDFSVRKGEIHGLLGENGAGKSTLMNILYGLYKPDEGEIYMEGRKVHIHSPQDSLKLGIGMIHQMSTLVPEFTAVENIVLGTEESGSRVRLDFSSARKEILKLSEKFGLKFPPDVKVKELSAGTKQKIEIIRALYRKAKILILDEPTAYLVGDEFDQLLKSLKVLVENGVTVIFITHKIREVMQACHRASVLKGGRMQGTVEIDKTTKEELVSLMFTGQNIDVTDSALPNVVPEPVKRSEKPICVVKNLNTRPIVKDGIVLKDVSFEIYGGEIFGIAGISGNGQKELAEAIVNPSIIASGEVVINGNPISNLSTIDIFKMGVFYTPEDRVYEAILPTASIKKNLLLGHHRDEAFLEKMRTLRWNRIKGVSKELIRKFNVKTPHEELEIRKLSGGNIQKVVFARALMNPIDLLVTHNPTAGLDMSSVKFVFEQLLDLRKNGKAILYLNEDLDELMIVSDRIGVLHEGCLVAIFHRDEFDKNRIGALMIGG
ncbi:MAG: ABC transporter ATP-binding protein [Thermotogae bacterium]|nr:ABC transporter ATP-binding protein [Thermotogota bacterium]